MSCRSTGQEMKSFSEASPLWKTGKLNDPVHPAAPQPLSVDPPCSRVM